MKIASFPWLKTGFIALMSLACLWFLAAVFDWRALAGALDHMRPEMLVPGALFYLASFGFRALRWQVMLAPIKPVPVGRLYEYLTLGYMTNNLLPARLGEFVRAWVTGRGEGLSRTAMLASVVLERVFDGLTIVAVFFGTLAFLPLGELSPAAGEVLALAAWLAPLIFLSGLGFLLLLAHRPEWTLALAARILRIVPGGLVQRIPPLLAKFSTGLALLKAPSRFALAVVLSFAVWLCEFAVYATLLAAFPHLWGTVSWSTLTMTLVGVNLFVMLPGLPGGLGYFQAACVWALTSLTALSATSEAAAGASLAQAAEAMRGEALLYSVALHATQILPTVALGYVFMWRLGVTWKEIRSVDIAPDPEGFGESGEIPTYRDHDNESSTAAAGASSRTQGSESPHLPDPDGPPHRS